MEERKLTVNEQVRKAVKAIDDLFIDPLPEIPPGATVESLWRDLCALRCQKKKPKKVEAIKLLLEDKELTGLPIGLLADIIRRVFEKRGYKCETSESSIRWYISQKTLVWNIQMRDKLGANLEPEP